MADFNLSYLASELNAAITKANAAAPQSTTYTKAEVDALIQTATKTVDQTYDATSVNAQSGIAVAEALGTIPVSQITELAFVNPDTSIGPQTVTLPNASVLAQYDLLLVTAQNQQVSGDHSVVYPIIVDPIGGMTLSVSINFVDHDTSDGTPLYGTKIMLRPGSTSGTATMTAYGSASGAQTRIYFYGIKF